MNKYRSMVEAFDQYVNRGPDGSRFPDLIKAAKAADVRGSVEKFGDGMSYYEAGARAFLAITEAKFSARYLGTFESSEEWGENNGAKVRGYIPVWRVTISTAAGRLSVRFRGSIHDGEQGRTTCGAYSVLSCLMKTEPGTFDEFAQEFGYFPLSSAASYRHARRVFAACVREFRGVCRVWPVEADRARLAEIN